MVNITKEKIIDYIFLTYLVLFPFGQVFHSFYFADILVGVIALYTLITDKSIFAAKGKFLTFLMIGSFSLLFSLNFLELPELLAGVLYFIRLTAYILLYFFVKSKYKTREAKETLVKGLIVVTFVVSIFGFIQYFFIPDLRALKVFGWDDHYFRLVSTFFDPTFTGIILLIGLILATKKYLEEKKKSYFLIGILELIAILLTYSRSTYLALVVSFVYFFAITRKKVLFIFPVLLLASIPFLPRPSSEGVKLERTYSIFQKFDDYKRGAEIYKISPVAGIGYDNLCKLKENYFSETNVSSHSCSGLDNSLLVVIATTGIIGLIFLMHVVSQIKINSLFAVVFVAVLTHSMFANTLFYSFVMGLMAIILAIGGNEPYTRT